TILRNETFDLSGIKVDYGLDSFSVEKANDQESHSKTNAEIHGVEEHNEAIAAQTQEDAEESYSKTNAEIHGVEAHNGPMAVQHQEDAEESYSKTNAEIHGVEVHNEPMAVQPQEDAEAQPTEIPVVPGNETLSLTEVFENELRMRNDFDASLPLIDKTNDLDGSIDTNALSIPTSQKMDTFDILAGEFVEDQRDRSDAGAVEIAEHAMEIRTQVETDGLEADNLCASLATGSKEANEYTDNQISVNGDLPMEENGNSMLGGLNEDQINSSGLGCDDKDAKSGGLFSENTEVDCLHSVALVDVKESSLNDEENPLCQEAALQNTMYPDVSAIRSPFVDQNN
ncbi:double-strand-break repair protein rad21-like protein, partial [Trifolium medium]|nr:double-strand-break repair protein rad21-like protein [Trifolium medium]